MGEFGAWLNEHWPETVSALAALATLAVVLWDRWKPTQAVIDATLRVHREQKFGQLEARLMIARPDFGFYEIDKIEMVGSPGVLLAERVTVGSYDPVLQAPEDGRRYIEPGWTVDMFGDHRTALFWFWALTPEASEPTRRSTSSTDQNVLRVRLSITHKAAKTLRSKITITTNRMA